MSAPPQSRKTAPSARAAPAQTGSSKIAIENLSHFSTGERLNESLAGTAKNFREFKILDFKTYCVNLTK